MAYHRFFQNPGRPRLPDPPSQPVYEDDSHRGLPLAVAALGAMAILFVMLLVDWLC